MGSTPTTDLHPSQQIKIKSPIVQRLRSNFRLAMSNKDTHSTKSCIHSGFANQINQKDSGQASTLYSPFVVLKSNSQKLFVNCTLISPICAIALYLPAFNNLIQTSIYITGKLPTSQRQQFISNAYQCKSLNIGMLLLQKPIWELGWCSVSYLSSSSLMDSTAMFSISVDEKDEKKLSYGRVFYHDMGSFVGKGEYQTGSLVYILIKRKPAIIGVQINPSFCKFFTRNVYEEMRAIMKVHLTLEKRRKSFEIYRYLRVRDENYVVISLYLILQYFLLFEQCNPTQKPINIINWMHSYQFQLPSISFSWHQSMVQLFLGVSSPNRGWFPFHKFHTTCLHIGFSPLKE